MSASERKIAELQRELEAAHDKIHELRHLLSAQMRTGEELEIEAIVNLDGVALVNLRWDQIAAQMPASEAQALFLDGLRVCEWAEVDAAVLRGMREAEFDDQAIAGMMTLLRESRGGSKDHAATVTRERET